MPKNYYNCPIEELSIFVSLLLIDNANTLVTSGHFFIFFFYLPAVKATDMRSCFAQIFEK